MLQAKPLTPDEVQLVGRIDKGSMFLDMHPDLEDFISGAQPEPLKPDGTPYNHLGDAQQEISQLDNARKHLDLVRRSRVPDAQAEIDRAVNSANTTINAIDDIIQRGISDPRSPYR